MQDVLHPTPVFLFAVLRDVQRNKLPSKRANLRTSFYSLSCETYSGTVNVSGRADVLPLTFLFAVLRDVQRNDTHLDNGWTATERFYSLSCETYSGTERIACRSAMHSGFYSLSCETYSGTRQTHTTHERQDNLLFAVLRDVQRNPTAKIMPLTRANVSLLHTLPPAAHAWRPVGGCEWVLWLLRGLAHTSSVSADRPPTPACLWRRTSWTCVSPSQHSPVEGALGGMRLAEALQGVPARGALPEEVERVDVRIQHLHGFGPQFLQVCLVERQDEDRLLNAITDRLQDGRQSRAARV